MMNKIKSKQFDNIDNLLLEIKSVVESYSVQKTIYLNDIEICISKASENYDNYFNLIFNNIDLTTKSFNDIESKLQNADFKSTQEWKLYPAIIIIEKNEEIQGIKIQSSSHDKLQINFMKNFDGKHLSSVIQFIQKEYFKQDVHKTELATKILGKLNEKNIDIYEDTDCIYQPDFWDIRVYGNIHITNYFDKARKKWYLNFHGFYVAKNTTEFENYLKKIFGNEVSINSETQLDSTLYAKLKVTDINGKEVLQLCFVKSDLFSIVYDKEKLSESEVLGFIEKLLDKQLIQLGGVRKIGTAEKINIGLINEFGFPALIITEQLKQLVELFGYKEDVNIIDIDDQTPIDNRRVNIIKNIHEQEQIDRLQKDYAGKIIFIGCALEHGFASISKQKLVEEYGTRIARTKQNFHTESSYKELANNLNPETNSELKQLQDNINKCYHLADFFITYDSDINSKLSKYKVRQQLKRLFFALHRHPFITPTKDEFMMHMAFSSALKSADLSRQVGAVITNKIGDILAVGANEVPRSGGGSYWTHVYTETGTIYDDAMGRDYMRGFDSNVSERIEIIKKIVNDSNRFLKGGAEKDFDKLLQDSKLKDITEYGRVVHAEMDALMACARNNISTLGATLYCTTFPCHNCAKHIIAAGVDRVVYLEPYAKSKAFSFHVDSVMDEEENPIATVLHERRLDIYKERFKNTDFSIENTKPKILFETFIGVGPKRFKEFFEMKKDERKNDDGTIKEWIPKLIINKAQ